MRHLLGGTGYGVEEGQLVQQPAQGVFKRVGIALLLWFLLFEEMAHQQPAEYIYLIISIQFWIHELQTTSSWQINSIGGQAYSRIAYYQRADDVLAHGG